MLDGTVQLRANHVRPSIEKGRASHRAMRPCRGVFFRERGYVIEPLTLPVILRKMRFPAFTEQLGLLPPPSRQRKRLIHPERLPSISASEEARHRIRGLATVESASGALSLS